MSRQKKIVVFDFDGVVCDSTDECMVTSWNAWQQWNNETGFRRTVEEFTDDEREEFKEVRPRVRGAGEYYILRRAFSEGININDQSIYNYLEKKWQQYITSFKSIFFEARNRLRHDDMDEWIRLHPIYDGVIEVMKVLDSQDRLYIATLKDGESVRLILGRHGLNISVERLQDQSQIKSKLQALDKIRRQINCDKDDMIFIDDNVTHLLDPVSAGYSVYLTTWGKTIEEYLQIARLQNIPLLDDCVYLLNE